MTSAAAHPAPSIHFVPSLRHNTVDRPRLRGSLLPRGGRERLALVHGPAGGGKTTVLTQWARSESHDANAIVWVALSDDDYTRTTFWERVLVALQDADIAQPGSALMRLDTASLTQSTLSSTLLRAFSSIDIDLCVVIDDYHLLDEPRVDEDVVALLESTERLQFAIGTRTRSRLNHVETAARIDMVVHDARSFAFTLAETEQLLESHAANRSGLAETIFEASAGWPLATRALLVEAETLAVDDSEPTLPSAAGRRSRFVEEYVDSILRRSDENGRRLLLHTALCLDVSVELAATLSVLSEAEAASYLFALERDGIVTKRSIGHDARYAFHPLVHSSLRMHALKLLAPGEVTNTHRQYAAWLETDRPEKAFALVCDIGDLDAATRVLGRHFAILTSLHAASTQATLARVAIDAVAKQPMLLSARLMLEYSNPATPLEWMQQWYKLITDELSRRELESSSPRFDGLALITGLHRMMGDGEAARIRSATLISKLSDPASEELAEIRNTVPLVHAVVAITALFNGQYDVADAHYALNESDAVSRGLELDAVRGRNGRALVAAISGDSVAAHTHIEGSQSDDFLAETNEHFGGLNYRIARAWTALEDLDFEDARSQLLALEPSEPVLETWPYIALATARLEVLSIGAATALRHFESTLVRKKKRPAPVMYIRAELTAMHVKLALLAGDQGHASDILATAAAEMLASREPEMLENPALTLASAQLLLVRGDNAGALAQANAASAAIAHNNPTAYRQALSATLIGAVASHRAGHHEAAFVLTEQAIAALHRTGLRTPLLIVPRADLLALFARANVTEDARLGGIIQLIEGLPDVHSSSRSVLQLSPAERRVLSTLRAAGSVTGAADALFVSANTIKSHLKRAYKKLGVNTANDAFAHAAASGQLDVTLER